MTREAFLARCACAFDAGLVTTESLAVLDAWTDMVMRLEGGQLNMFAERLQSEQRRTDGFHSSRTLANDADGYRVIQLTAILRHPCQICATDRLAWWTRTAMCPHRTAGRLPAEPVAEGGEGGRG